MTTEITDFIHFTAMFTLKLEVDDADVDFVGYLLSLTMRKYLGILDEIIHKDALLHQDHCQSSSIVDSVLHP